ncbi:MAG: SDR family NAD(P)-dependent oxidoreductase, partial [Salinisphaera sp.]|nr:SDR family NAD(P)-dependent oxidoreductase [Salinisphaera sp.]
MGRALALRLAARGDTLVLLARRGELLDALAEQIGAGGGKARALACDVTDAQAVRAAFACIHAELGAVDRLVVCAGGGAPTFVDQLSGDDVDACVQRNFIGAVHCIAAVRPAMRARGSGHLVAIGSLAGHRGLPTAAAYSASKAALANFMESLRIDLRGSGVDVTLLLPGFVRSRPGKGNHRGKPLR